MSEDEGLPTAQDVRGILPRSHAQGANASLRDAVDRIVVSAMSWQPSENGPSFDGKFNELMARFDAALRSPAASEVERLKDANDYHDHHPLTGFRKPAASEGPFNAEMPSSLNDACRRLDLAQERISQLEAQVEEASGLIHDLLGLELGSSERAMAWLDSRSDTSTESRVEQTRDLPREGKFEMQTNLCSDCPPTGYGTDVTRCTQCPRATSHPSTMCTCGGDPGQPASDHDISCPAALSTTPHVLQSEDRK